MSRYALKFKRWLFTSGATALASGVVASVGTFIVTDIQDSRSKLRERENEAISKQKEQQNEAISKLRDKQYEAFITFFSEDDGLLVASKSYVDAVLKKRSLKKPAEELADQVKKQVRSVEKLTTVFTGDDVNAKIADYQRALLAFSSSIDEFVDEGTGSDWSNNFKKVVNSKIALKENLMKAIKG